MMIYSIEWIENKENKKAHKSFWYEDKTRKIFLCIIFIIIEICQAKHQNIEINH